MTSPTDTHPDAAFEAEVRAMLARRAEEVCSVDPALPDGIRIAIDHAPDGPSRRGRLLAVAAAIVLVLGLVAVVAGRSADGPTTEVAEEGPPTTSAPPAGHPIAGLPEGVAAEDLLPFWDQVSAVSPRTDDPAGDVAAGYLEDRVGSVAWSPSEVDGEWAEVPWTLPVQVPGGPSPDPPPGGTIHLRLIDDRWQVVAAISPTISIAGLAHDGSRLTGEVSEATGAPIRLVASDLDGDELAGAELGTASGSPRDTSVMRVEISTDDRPVLVRVVSGDRPGEVGLASVGVAGVAEVVLAPPSGTDEPPAPTATTAPPTTAPPTTAPPTTAEDPVAPDGVPEPAVVIPSMAVPVGADGAPEVAGLPEATVLATTPAVFTGDEGASARDVAEDYLADRLQLFLVDLVVGLSEPGPGPDPATWAVLRYDVGATTMEDLPTGLVVLRRDGSAWAVVAASTDGVDLSGVRRDEDAVTGTVGGDGIDSLAADVTDLAGTPVPSSPDPGSPQDLLPGQRPIGTAAEARGTVAIDVPVAPGSDVAIQFRYVGGSILSISEVALPA